MLKLLAISNKTDNKVNQWICFYQEIDTWWRRNLLLPVNGEGQSKASNKVSRLRLKIFNLRKKTDIPFHRTPIQNITPNDHPRFVSRNSVIRWIRAIENAHLSAVEKTAARGQWPSCRLVHTHTFDRYSVRNPAIPRTARKKEGRRWAAKWRHAKEVRRTRRGGESGKVATNGK